MRSSVLSALVLMGAYCSTSVIAQTGNDTASRTGTGIRQIETAGSAKKLELNIVVGDQFKPPAQYSRALINLQNSIKTLAGVPVAAGSQLRLGSPEIKQRPIIIISTTGQFELTAAEIKNLREYIEHGGFLLFDYAGANITNNLSGPAILAAVREITGRNKVEPIPPDHPIFQTPFLLEGPPSGLATAANFYQPPRNEQERQARQTWQEQQRYSDQTKQLMGVFIDGRLVLLYSPRGYYAMWNDVKNESQLKFGVNIVMYAAGLE